MRSLGSVGTVGQGPSMYLYVGQIWPPRACAWYAGAYVSHILVTAASQMHNGKHVGILVFMRNPESPSTQDLRFLIQRNHLRYGFWDQKPSLGYLDHLSKAESLIWHLETRGPSAPWADLTAALHVTHMESLSTLYILIRYSRYTTRVRCYPSCLP